MTGFCGDRHYRCKGILSPSPRELLCIFVHHLGQLITNCDQNQVTNSFGPGCLASNERRVWTAAAWSWTLEVWQRILRLQFTLHHFTRKGRKGSTALRSQHALTTKDAPRTVRWSPLERHIAGRFHGQLHGFASGPSSSSVGGLGLVGLQKGDTTTSLYPW